MTKSDVEQAALKLLAYCHANDWAGYDPYDALNSRMLTALPLLNFKFSRLALTQALKRCPINIRRAILVPKTQNPKAIALFLAAILKPSRIGCGNEDALVEVMIERLMARRSPGVPYWCWGYSFPWQTRSIIVPAGAPNVVCTSFVAGALLDAYDEGYDPKCLSMALSAAEYMLDQLYWTDGASVAGFSYPMPSARGQVHNANLVAASLLCRAYKYTGKERFLDRALRVVRYSAAKQNPDGSWHYGEAASQRWIDNFHTGYNLCSLHSISRSLDTTEFDPCIRRGLEFYRAHFLREDGAVRYFHNCTYPIDIHCVAQTIITLLAFRALDQHYVALARSVLKWAMNHMWDERGFFYYRVLRCCTIRTSYMRWSQAWMLLAMSTLLGDSDVPAQKAAQSTVLA